MSLVQTQFDYAEHGIKAADVKSLESAATKVVKAQDAVRRKTVQSVLDIGAMLKAAHSRLANHKNGTFEAWCEGRCGIGKMAASRAMNSHEVFGEYRNKLLPYFDVSALYVLSSPSCPQEARDEALAMADAGEHVTHAAAKSLAERHATPNLTRDGVDTGYRVVLADPPWKYSDGLIDGYGAAEHHYPTLSIEQLCAMDVKAKVKKNAVLFMWVTSPLLEDAFTVIDAWGFEYKTTFVWDKVRHNYGHYNSVRHEFLLVCTRGSCTPDSSALSDSVVVVERDDKHSRKPEQFYELIDTMYVPPKRKVDRIELFARDERTGWHRWGNEAGNA